MYFKIYNLVLTKTILKYAVTLYFPHNNAPSAKMAQNIHTIEHSTQWDRATKTKILLSFRCHCLLNSMAILYHVMKKAYAWQKDIHYNLYPAWEAFTAGSWSDRWKAIIIYNTSLTLLLQWFVSLVDTCHPFLQTVWKFARFADSLIFLTKLSWIRKKVKEKLTFSFYFMISTNKNTMRKECMNIKQTCRSFVISCSSDADKSWYVLIGFSLRRLLLIRNRKYLLLCLDRFILSSW